MKDLTDYYATVGFFRGQGFDEAHAYHHAHELMEAGLLTRDNGLIVEVEGRTFQLTIVKA